MQQKANYIAKKSLLATVTPLCLLFFWLVIPLIVMIVRMVRAGFTTVEFYDNKIVSKSGIISRSEKVTVFAGVNAVSVSQSLLGRIFNYGDVNVDVRGKWDIDTSGIRNPVAFKAYLETRTADVSDMTFIAHE